MRTTILIAAIVAAGAVRADPTAGDVTVAGARVPPTRIGVSLGLGGGVTNFTSSEMTDVSDVGGAWELRATVGTRLFFAGEFAYVGTRRNVTLLGVNGHPGEKPHVFSNGLEAAARVQYPYLTGNWLLEPFAFGGVGWNHIGVDAIVGANSPMRTSDDVLVMPFGAGISAAWKGVFVEARFTYRPAFNEDLLTKNDGTVASLTTWSTGALVGYEF